MTQIAIYIFEDDWMCREAIRSVVDRTPDMELVGEADNAENALDHAIGLRPDVVLMDIRLKGGMDGIGATEALTGRCPHARVIIFTSFPDAETLHTAILSGAAGYLLKEETGDPDILIRAIREVAKGNAYMTPRMGAEVLKIIRKRQKINDFGLTRRESEILGLLSEGLNNRTIARKLNIRERTVANHISNILFKTNTGNRTEAACVARKYGLLHSE
jgi:DNA-binding NarL/FixJ family response regulator